MVGIGAGWSRPPGLCRPFLCPSSSSGRGMLGMLDDARRCVQVRAGVCRCVQVLVGVRRCMQMCAGTVRGAGPDLAWGCSLCGLPRVFRGFTLRADGTDVTTSCKIPFVFATHVGALGHVHGLLGVVRGKAQISFAIDFPLCTKLTVSLLMCNVCCSKSSFHVYTSLF